jgi:hypothetical protein
VSRALSKLTPLHHPNELLVSESTDTEESTYHRDESRTMFPGVERSGREG